jgi:hypothetical protein
MKNKSTDSVEDAPPDGGIKNPGARIQKKEGAARHARFWILRKFTVG